MLIDFLHVWAYTLTASPIGGFKTLFIPKHVCFNHFQSIYFVHLGGFSARTSIAWPSPISTSITQQAQKKLNHISHVRMAQPPFLMVASPLFHGDGPCLDGTLKALIHEICQLLPRAQVASNRGLDGIGHPISGGWYTYPFWKMMEFVSWDDDIPKYGKIKAMFQTTNQIYIYILLAWLVYKLVMANWMGL